MVIMVIGGDWWITIAKGSVRILDRSQSLFQFVQLRNLTAKQARLPFVRFVNLSLIQSLIARHLRISSS